MLIKTQEVRCCLTFGDGKAYTFSIAADLPRLAEERTCPTALLHTSGLLKTSGTNKKKKITPPQTNPFCLDSIRWTTLGYQASAAEQTAAA